MRTALVVPAAGRGDRLGATRPKALVPLGGEPLLVHALRRAVAARVLDVVVVVAPEGAQDEVRAVLTPLALPDLRVVAGGDERQDSVRAGLDVLPADVDVVLVHDAARCLTPPALFVAVVGAVRAGAVAVVPVVAVSDTVKRVAGTLVLETVDRRDLVAVQTPQGFARAPLQAAHAAAAGTGAPATDDAGMLEALGHEVRTVPGHEHAFKVTRPVDLLFAGAVLAASPGTS